jgi:hypothetical protein
MRRGNGSINRAFNPLLKNNRFAWGDVVDYNGSPLTLSPDFFFFQPLSEILIVYIVVWGSKKTETLPLSSSRKRG